MPDLKPPFIPQPIPAIIDRDMRVSGLLARLSPQDLQTLVCLLTYVYKDGRCALSGRDVAIALNLSEKQGTERLRRLARLRFQGKPLVIAAGRNPISKFAKRGYRVLPVPGLKVGMDKQESGGSEGGRRRDIPSISQEALFPLSPGETVKFPPPGGSPRTRGLGKPASGSRTDTASDNSFDNNKTTHRTTEEGEVKEGEKGLFELLINHGVSKPAAADLVRSFPAETIRRQIEMLPYRDARDPAAMLVKAIRDDWDAPSAYKAMLREKAAKREREEAQLADEARRKDRQRRIQEIISNLSPQEMRDVTVRAREKVKATLRGALGGRIPQRLVDAQVKKIIAEEYLSKSRLPCGNT